MSDKSQYDEIIELYFPMLQRLGRPDLIDAIRAARYDPSRQDEVLEELKRIARVSAEVARKSREAVIQGQIEDRIRGSSLERRSSPELERIANKRSMENWWAGEVIYDRDSGGEIISILTECRDGLWRGHAISRHWHKDGVWDEAWQVSFDIYISSVTNPSARPVKATPEQAALLRAMLLSNPLYGRQRIRPF